MSFLNGLHPKSKFLAIIEEFNQAIERYYLERNVQRRFKKLDWKTPNEWLKDYRITQKDLLYGHNYKFMNQLLSAKSKQR